MTRMKFRFVLVTAAMLLLASNPLFAKSPAATYPNEDFWVNFWGQPKVILNGPDEQDFYQNVHEVKFAHDRFDHALDEDTLNADVQWLKGHSNARFFIEGYASVTGTEPYNLHLSGQRADWVRQVMIRKGIAANRIVLAVPWGMLYPACTEETEKCHAKNRIVRFAYSPN